MEPKNTPAIIEERVDSSLPARLDQMKTEIKRLQSFFKEVMVDGEDYGVIPGTVKPTLLKPGAEKLAEFYNYSPILKGEPWEQIDPATGYYRARITMQLIERSTGAIIAEGIGEANTMEGRYHWREAKRQCPECGSPAIIKGKPEYGGGWLCFKKQGGCGTKYAENDHLIVGQTVGRVENTDPWALWNTVLKMAKKRALVDVVLSATRSSGLFTQDAEDLKDWIEGEVIQESQAPTQEEATQGRKEAAQRITPIRKAIIQKLVEEAPDSEQTASSAKSDELVRWNQFWGFAHQLGLNREKVHAYFGVPVEDGALLEYARQRAQSEEKPLHAIVFEMHDELTKKSSGDRHMI